MAEISHSAHRIGMEMGTGEAGLQRADMRQSDHELRQSDPLHRTRRQGVIAAMPIPLSWWVEMSAVSRLRGITISAPQDLLAVAKCMGDQGDRLSDRLVSQEAPGRRIVSLRV